MKILTKIDKACDTALSRSFIRLHGAEIFNFYIPIPPKNPPFSPQKTTSIQKGIYLKAVRAIWGLTTATKRHLNKVKPPCVWTWPADDISLSKGLYKQNQNTNFLFWSLKNTILQNLKRVPSFSCRYMWRRIGSVPVREDLTCTKYLYCFQIEIC